MSLERLFAALRHDLYKVIFSQAGFAIFAIRAAGHESHVGNLVNFSRFYIQLSSSVAFGKDGDAQ